MTKSKDNIKILLLQMRGDKSKEHEMRCILKYGELKPEQVDSYDTLTEATEPAGEIVAGYDAVIIGGANEFRVSHDQPGSLSKIEEIIRYCNDNSIPLLGLCYGAHAIAEALGGKVEFKPELKEVTTVDIYRLPAAKEDLLFKDMPDTFKANCGRTDDITELPITAVPLANSDKVQFHAFKIAGKPTYGTQFHAELGKKEEWDRMEFAFHFGGYFKDEADLQEHKDTVTDTPEATSLVVKFIDRVVLGHDDTETK